MAMGGQWQPLLTTMGWGVTAQTTSGQHFDRKIEMMRSALKGVEIKAEKEK
jgi:hypothetical protein